ncbi:MAG: hypothetical protein MHM6MM_005372 [Cercozoa sp. M6MM]
MSTERFNAIVGATGKVGRLVVQQLLRNPQVETVTALVRTQRPAEFYNVSDDEAARLHQVPVQFGSLNASGAELFQVPTQLGFCCLGTTRAAAGSARAFELVDYDYVVESATLMKQHGVSRFSLCSSQGASSSSWFLYPKTKGRAEEACKNLDFEHCSIARPGMLFGRNDKSRTLEYWVGKITPSFAGVHIQKVAIAIVHNALQEQPEELLTNSRLKEIAEHVGNHFE